MKPPPQPFQGVICLTDPRTTAILPCRHLCLCQAGIGDLAELSLGSTVCNWGLMSDYPGSSRCEAELRTLLSFDGQLLGCVQTHRIMKSPGPFMMPRTSKLIVSGGSTATATSGKNRGW